MPAIDTDTRAARMTPTVVTLAVCLSVCLSVGPYNQALSLSITSANAYQTSSVPTSHTAHSEITVIHGSRNSTVTIVTTLQAEQPTNRGSIPGNGKRLFSSPKRPIGYAARPASYSVGVWGSSPGREGDHLPRLRMSGAVL